MADGNEDLGTQLTTTGTEVKLKSLNVLKPRREGGQSITTQRSKRPGM